MSADADLQALREAMSSLIDRWGQHILRLEEELAEARQKPSTERRALREALTDLLAKWATDAETVQCAGYYQQAERIDACRNELHAILAALPVEAEPPLADHMLEAEVLGPLETWATFLDGKHTQYPRGLVARLCAAYRRLAQPVEAEPPIGRACVNCGEAREAGYTTGEVGPFCSACWEKLEARFTKPAVEAEPPPDMRLAVALGALADIAHSTDMTLAVARRKAARIYRELNEAAPPVAAEPPTCATWVVIVGKGSFSSCYGFFRTDDEAVSWCRANGWNDAEEREIYPVRITTTEPTPPTEDR